MDICPQCGEEKEIAVDDFGVYLCQECLDNDLEAQQALIKGAENERFMFGYDD